MEVIHRAGYKHRNDGSLSRNLCKASNRQQEGNKTYNDETAFQHGLIEQKVVTCDGDIRRVEALRTVNRNQHKDKIEQLKSNDACEPDEIRSMQMKDPNIGLIMTALEEGRDRMKWEDVPSSAVSLKTSGGRGIVYAYKEVRRIANGNAITWTPNFNSSSATPRNKSL
ncbi:hypothetical protein CHS0354_001350 [Potamilus streckersoni]|uniref:Uncharacterized protein n=1 Tax=Potamilus streckersoni TaxID=2493646 RepID=A0AAE0WDK3_9BIVA|nr:hypothetical protein CHS0354_001350 [Potamilus streckersoni]